MMLFVDGSDITRLVVADAEVRDGRVTLASRQTRDIGPEQYLAAIMEMLGTEQLEALLVVTGPGSATALRASLAIANTLGFTTGATLYAVPVDVPQQFPLPAAVATLVPHYAAAPRVTPSSRDDLRRTAL